MTECDGSRIAEIEKAVVEQAHCYLPPRCLTCEQTAVDFLAWVVLAGVIGGLVGVSLRQAFKH